MKLIIEHSNTKRVINGPFNLCLDRNSLLLLKNVIDSKLKDEEFNFGWINFNEWDKKAEETFDVIKVQKSIINTEPTNWDE